MDLNRWKVFRSLDPAVSAQVKLAFTWGHARAAFIVMENDDVFCVGQDNSGILGGYKKAKFPLKIEELCGQAVIDFQCGQNFVMALTKDGRVYEWTENFLPELQTGFPEKAGIVQIAAGLGHSMALTSCGKVYCWGANEDGQLGMGNFTEQLKPRKVIPAPGVEIDKKIISIACGRSSSFAVSEDGDVWAWGDKLEVGNYRASNNENTPRLILQGKKIAKIVCSASCTMAVSIDFNLHFWQHADYGGLRFEIKRPSLDPVLDVGSSIHTSFIAYSTPKSVWVVGKWFDRFYDHPKITSYASVDEAFACYIDATMCRPVRPFRPPEAAPLCSLEALFDDATSSDLKFVVGDKIIHAHKAFLEKRSSYFNRMFGSDWKEATAGTIKIESYSYDVFRCFLNYLYTGKLSNLDCAGMLELLKAADYYQEEGLARKCEQLIKLDVTVENVCLVYSVAVEHNAKELKLYALDFARPVFTDVINSEGFAALNKNLTTQLMRELVLKRRLVVANNSSSESDEEERKSDSDANRSDSNSSRSRVGSPRFDPSSSDSDSNSSHYDTE